MCFTTCFSSFSSKHSTIMFANCLGEREGWEGGEHNTHHVKFYSRWVKFIHQGQIGLGNLNNLC